MLYINECLTNNTPIKLVNVDNKRSLFEPVEPKVYFKKFNHAEFIGEELANIRNIHCSHYFIAGLTRFRINKTLPCSTIDKYSPTIGIGSYDFKNSNKNYKLISEYDVRDDNGFESMLKHAKDEDNKRLLCRDMLELLALDLYMGQVDRSNVNVMFEEDKVGNVRLAPLYDFEYSLNNIYHDFNSISNNSLYSFDNIDECKEFIGKYPMFRDILGSYLNVNLVDVISRAYNKRGLLIPSDRWNFYIDFDHSQKEKIKRIVK